MRMMINKHVEQHAVAAETVAGGCQSSAKKHPQTFISQQRSINFLKTLRSISKLRLQGLLLLVLLLASPLFAETLALQSFESQSTDTWSYTASPSSDSKRIWRDPTPPTEPVVSNVTFSQRTDGSGLVDIYYDLYDANGDNSTVGLLLSTDGGASFGTIPTLEYLSGDIGANIANGTAKHIIWNADAEAGDYDNNNYRLRVTAEDGTNPMPANFVLVAGGTFSNGTSNVTVSSFYMDKYELTQAGYQAVMGSNPASGYGVGSNYPVYYVSWFNAIEYCNRRSLQEGLIPCYSYSSNGTNPANWPAGWNTSNTNHTNVACNWTANGYRLPTVMEWQFAARGGNLTHNYTYSGSNDINAVAWYNGNSGSTTHTVGTKTANELGLFDMSGNVWEWSWDIYGSYPSGSQNNPTGASSGSYRVIRGGGWGDSAAGCAVPILTYSGATFSINLIGFRVVRVSQ